MLSGKKVMLMRILTKRLGEVANKMKLLKQLGMQRKLEAGSKLTKLRVKRATRTLKN